jgi:dihydroorotate dehydrogenase (NAD+) catalytic subunit
MNSSVDLTVCVGELSLASPILTAAGTAGHGGELSAYVDLTTLGAVTVKSLSADPWPGNPAPRLYPVRGGMLNSVGLQGPGIAAWLTDELPLLEALGVKVVVSIWGTSVGEFARAAKMLVGASDSVIALEINISCPNTEDGARMFSQSTVATREVIEACAVAGLPRWAKLTPAVTNIVEIAGAAKDGGADAVTLINTVLGLGIDIESRRPVLGGIGGGLSGPAIHAVALRAVYDCHLAYPELAIVGVGGVNRGEDAVAMMMAGASAVGVGSATLARPRATARILTELTRWCRRHNITRVADLTGALDD